jgi:DNA-binding MarR family transcriptional regulator
MVWAALLLPRPDAQCSARLHAAGDRGPLTIQQLAEAVEVTHSGMSRTVSSLRAEGLVTTGRGADARTRLARLTDRGRGIPPFLEA